MSAKIDLERAVAAWLASDVADVSQASRAAADRAAVTSTTVIAVVLALTIALSVLMARSMVRPLGVLRQAANDVAERQLPGVVDRLLDLIDDLEQGEPDLKPSTTCSTSTTWPPACPATPRT
jgi:nitrogen fixation/metabolism regulation signal transduction histidine kinase